LFRKAELFPLTSRVVRKGALSQLPSILQGATNFLLDQEQPRCDNSAMRSTPKSNRACSQEGAVLTKATIRAADRLDVSQTVLASIIGISEPVVSRMRHGPFTLEPNNGKAFELAALFVRLYLSLDSLVSGDEAVAKAWLKNESTALQCRPLDLIQKVHGLVDVIHYLDARRALD